MILKFSGWVESLIMHLHKEMEGWSPLLTSGIPELAYSDLPEIENETVECLPNS